MLCFVNFVRTSEFVEPSAAKGWVGTSFRTRISRPLKRKKIVCLNKTKYTFISAPSVLELIAFTLRER